MAWVGFPSPEAFLPGFADHRQMMQLTNIIAVPVIQVRLFFPTSRDSPAGSAVQLTTAGARFAAAVQAAHRSASPIGIRQPGVHLSTTRAPRAADKSVTTHLK